MVVGEAGEVPESVGSSDRWGSVVGLSPATRRVVRGDDALELWGRVFAWVSG